MGATVDVGLLVHDLLLLAGAAAIVALAVVVGWCVVRVWRMTR
jgi:hypothetical protein